MADREGSEEIIKIFLASPGDVQRERGHVEAVAHELNNILWQGGRHLEVIRWEEDARPAFGADPQALLNEQIAMMERVSLFVGIMWNRFGAPTARADSGTVEEFDRAVAAWTQTGRPDIWFYFRDAPAKLNSEDQLKQREKVLAFKKQVQAKGLTRSYANPARFRIQFRNDLDQWLRSRDGKKLPIDLTGDWTIDDGSSKYEARLTQTEDSVSGDYRLPGGTGVLTGEIKDGWLTVHWDQAFNQRGGDAKLEISNDGKKLVGEWYYDPDEYESGLRGRGLWTFEKRGKGR